MCLSSPQALLQTQAELRQLVPGFTFNAGFVGGYYDNGLETEVRYHQLRVVCETSLCVS